MEHLPGDVGETAGVVKAAKAARDAEALPEIDFTSTNWYNKEIGQEMVSIYADKSAFGKPATMAECSLAIRPSSPSADEAASKAVLALVVSTWLKTGMCSGRRWTLAGCP